MPKLSKLSKIAEIDSTCRNCRNCTKLLLFLTEIFLLIHVTWNMLKVMVLIISFSSGNVTRYGRVFEWGDSMSGLWSHEIIEVSQWGDKGISDWTCNVVYSLMSLLLKLRTLRMICQKILFIFFILIFIVISSFLAPRFTKWTNLWQKMIDVHPVAKKKKKNSKKKEKKTLIWCFDQMWTKRFYFCIILSHILFL